MLCLDACIFSYGVGISNLISPNMQQKKKDILFRPFCKSPFFPPGLVTSTLALKTFQYMKITYLQGSWDCTMRNKRHSTVTRDPRRSGSVCFTSTLKSFPVWELHIGTRTQMKFIIFTKVRIFLIKRFKKKNKNKTSRRKTQLTKFKFDFLWGLLCKAKFYSRQVFQGCCSWQEENRHGIKFMGHAA